MDIDNPADVLKDLAIYIVRHSDHDRDDIVGVFIDEQKARRRAFEHAARNFGPGARTTVLTYRRDGAEVKHASIWRTPEPPERPQLSPHHIEMQQQHEKALDEYEKALSAYEAIKNKFGRPE